MATFRYRARDRAGAAVASTVEAENREAVASSLKKQGLQIVTLEEASAGRSPFDLSNIAKRFKAGFGYSETVLFTRQLALMIRSGLPLIEGIEGIRDQVQAPDFKQTLSAVSQDLRGGKSFSEALARHPAVFPNFFVSMVKAGETAGTLDEVLERLATIGEEEMELKGKVRAAFAYPCLLVALSSVIVTFLLIYVLPKFILIFEESGVALPLPTRILMGISFLLSRFWFVVPVAAAVGFQRTRAYARTPAGRYRFDELALRLPLFGDLILKTIFARSFSSLASLLRSGIAAVPALEITQEIVDNEVLSRALAQARQAVVGGSSLADALRAQKIFPVTVSQLVSVGEKTGALDETFAHLGDFYKAEVDRSLRTMTAVLEPLLLLTMGLIVAFIALSVLLPIFQLIRVFKR